MAMFTFTVFINSSPQDVFDLLSNPLNCHQWIPPMQSAAWTSSGTRGVGLTGRGVINMAGQGTELQLEITRWDPPSCYGVKILNVQLPFETMEYVYTLEPVDGGTRVTLDGGTEWANSQ
jgi:uncharacterized protein YndB with AHSA1/START domain